MSASGSIAQAVHLNKQQQQQQLLLHLEYETMLNDGKVILYGGGPMLGSGSYAKVYPCMLKETVNEQVTISHGAVKCAEVPISPGSRKERTRLEQELKNWMDLSQPNNMHDNVLRMLAGQVIWEGNHKLFALAVTDLMDMTLEQLIFEDKEFIEECTYKSLLEIAEKICGGLAHLHGKKFIHYDLKPSNVLVSKNGKVVSQVKISDFGFTKKVDDNRASVSGSYRGTPQYMAPEITSIQGAFSNSENRVSSAADIYSLGVLLWVLFNGKRPSDFQEVPKDFGKHIKQTSSNGTQEIWCRAPHEICDLIESCLSYDSQNSTDRSHGRPSAGVVRETLTEMFDEPWANNRPHSYRQEGEIAIEELERLKNEKEKLMKEKKNVEEQLEKAKADGGELEKRMREMAINHAAERGDWETIQELLDKEQLDVNAMSENNSSPLHWAAGCGTTDLVEKLLDRGVEVDLKDKDGHTPFCCAVFHGHFDAAEMLLRRGACVDALDIEGSSPLHAAAACGHEEAVKFLVHHGASKDLKNNNGETPRDVAGEHSLEGVL